MAATDASGRAGGIAASIGLSQRGRDRLKTSLKTGYQKCGDEFGIWSWFDGIGAIRQAWEWLKLPLACHISVETNPDAKRVIASRWPGAVMLGDINDLDRRDLLKLRRRFHKVRLLLRAGGFPCQDLSSLNFGGAGLDGTKSSVYYVMKSLETILQEEWRGVTMADLKENVASMHHADTLTISQSEGVKPLKICSSQVGWCRRPRYYWCRNMAIVSDGETVILEEDMWFHLKTTYQRPSENTWLKRGSSWGGRVARPDAPNSHPTLVRFIKRKKPPWKPANLDSCDSETVARWTADAFGFPPYQYKPHSMIVDANGTLRLATAGERERLMHFPDNYTIAAVPSSMYKIAPHSAFVTRVSLLGNSMDCLPTACLLGRLAGAAGYLSRPPIHSTN